MEKPDTNPIFEYWKAYGKAIVVIIIVALALIFLLNRL